MAQGGSQPQGTLLGTVPKGTQEPAGGSWGHPLPCLGVGGHLLMHPRVLGGTCGCARGDLRGALRAALRGAGGAPRAVPEDPEEQLPLRLGVLRGSCCHALGVLGRGGTWRTWCPRGPKCHCTWQRPLSPVRLKALGCSHLGDHSRVSSAPGTPPALSLRSGTVAAAESRPGPCHPHGSHLPAVPWGN